MSTKVDILGVLCLTGRTSWKVPEDIEEEILDLMKNKDFKTRTKALRYLIDHYNNPEKKVRDAYATFAHALDEFDDDMERVAGFKKKFNKVLEDFFKDDTLLLLIEEYHDYMSVHPRFSNDGAVYICDKAGIKKDDRNRYLGMMLEEVK